MTGVLGVHFDGTLLGAVEHPLVVVCLHSIAAPTWLWPCDVKYEVVG